MGIVRSITRPLTEAVSRKSGASSRGMRGANLIVNGTFAADTDWTKGAGWTIGSGVATRTNTGANSALSQTAVIALEAGAIYEAKVTISGYVSGTLQPRFSGGVTVSGSTFSGNGTNTQLLTAVTGNNGFRYTADTTFAGSIDNVTLRRVS